MHMSLDTHCNFGVSAVVNIAIRGNLVYCTSVTLTSHSLMT
jgi:hypothetical protein